MNRLKSLMPLVLLLLSGEALAAKKVLVLPVVVLAEDRIGSESGSEMTAAIIEELKLNPNIKPVVGTYPRVTRQKKETGRKPLRSDAEYRRGMRKLEEGEKHSKRLRFPKAIAALSSAVELLNRNIEFVADYDRFIDAHMLLAVAYFRRGKESKGIDLLEQVLRYRPTMALDPKQYPPMFVRVFERTRDRLLAREPGEISIVSDEVGAKVFLNGESMGTVPIEIDQVFPGKNHLVVMAASGASWGRLVAVRSGKRREIRAAFGGGASKGRLSVKEEVAQNSFDSDTRRFLLQEGKKKRADYVVSLGMGSGLGVFVAGGFLGDVRTGKWLRLNSLSPDVDMLSASIEANSLAQNLFNAFREFSPTIDNETIPYIEGKKIGGKAGAAAATVTYESFFNPNELKRTPVIPLTPSGRTPLVAGTTGHAPRPAQTKPSGNISGGARTPIGSTSTSSSKGGAFPERGGATAAAEAPPTPRRQAPLSRDSAGPQKSKAPVGRGPLVSTGGEDFDDSDILRDSNRAANRIGSGSRASPITQDLTLDGRYSTPITEEWWFWSSIGVVGLALAGSATWYFFLDDGEPTSVTVNAEW